MTISSLNDDDFLTAKQVSDFLSISRRTLCRWHRMRRGPPRIKIGRSVLYRRASVHDWLRSVEQPAG